MTDYAEQIRHDMAQAIQPEQPHLMPGDKWLLSSAMQKAIRRSDVGVAMSAGASYWHQDKQGFYRRVLVTALEDVSLGGSDAVCKVIAAVASPTWRREHGELQVGLYLVRLLCDAVKNRLCDAVFILAERSPAFRELRERFATAEDYVLADYFFDDTHPLVGRSIAAWLLAGTRRFPSDHLPKRTGSLESAASAMRMLKVPTLLVESCITALPLIPWPLMMFIPLIWQHMQRHPHHIRHDAIPAAGAIDGLPLYAADMFTRVGKSCYGQLRKSVPGLQIFTPQQIGLSVFYAEGSRTDRTLTAPALEEIQREGEFTDLGGAGLPADEYARLRECLADNMDVLAEIRRIRLQGHLAELAASARGQS